MSKKLRNTVIKIIVSVVLFGFILINIDTNSLIANIKLMDVAYIPLILTLFIANYVISSIRWKFLLIYKNSEKATIPFLTSLYFIGSFFNNFMPTSIGGDVYKMFKLGQKIDSKADAVSATFMERFTGMVALVIISYFGLIKTLDFWIAQLPNNLKSNEIFVFGFEFLLFVGFWLAAILGFMFLKFFAKKFTFLSQIYDSLIKYNDHKRVLLNAFITSFIVQFIAVLTQYYVFQGMGVTIPFGYAILAFPVIFLASFFIPSLNGLGVQDAMYIYFFTNIGVTPEVALSASIIYHLFRLSVSLIGGVLYAFGKAD